jgi:chemotaxis protein CheY-P-specific phosphatase CheC
MQDQKTPTLNSIFSEVLQNLAFMFHDEDEAEIAPGEVWLETVIRYRGPQDGTLRLRCTRDFAVLLAANLLGTDPESADSLGRAGDAVKEFMNILCGQYVTARHGVEDVFDLTIPEIEELTETPDFTPGPEEEAAGVSVQGHRVQVLYRPQA